MATPHERPFVVLDLSKQPTVPYRIPDPYQPPEEIIKTSERFWRQVTCEPGELHWRWNGAMGGSETRPRFSVGGKLYTVWDFAYLSKVDELYPGLIARPICGHELCVRPEHIRPRWKRNLPRPTKDHVFFAFHARLRHHETRRRAHRDLFHERDIAEAYGLPLEQIEEWSRDFRKRFMLHSV